MTDPTATAFFSEQELDNMKVSLGTELTERAARAEHRRHLSVHEAAKLASCVIWDENVKDIMFSHDGWVPNESDRLVANPNWVSAVPVSEAADKAIAAVSNVRIMR